MIDPVEVEGLVQENRRLKEQLGDLKTENEKLVGQNRGLFDILPNMGIRLESSVRMLSTISQLTAVTLEGFSLRSAVTEILEILVREHNDIENCSVLLYDPAENLLRLLAARGAVDLLGEQTGPYNRNLTFRIGEGIAGRVFAENRPRFWDETSSDPGLLKRNSGSFTPPALACLPLSTRDQTIGVLNVSFGTPEPLPSHRKRDLSIMSGVVANIVQTLLLRCEVDEKSASLHAKVLECEREIIDRLRVEEDRERLIGELQNALAEVKRLSGLLPICVNCKKIRNDEGYWEQVESYIRKHSEAEFSHGICPECAKVLYPEFRSSHSE
ncbi:MAG: GAF domain-containing protein [Deltaproteobacteria bacterium]|nr:GAF domain-containing protein [Deltaproteobacteria bacterium]